MQGVPNHSTGEKGLVPRCYSQAIRRDCRFAPGSGRGGTLLRFLLLVLLGLGLPAPVMSAEREVLVLGVFAYLGEERTRAKYQPIVDHLNTVLEDERIELRVLPQDELYRAVNQREVDLVSTNPTHFLVMRKSHPLTGVIATLVESGPAGEPLHQLGGAIVTLSDRDDLHELDDLADRVIASPGTLHLGGYRAQAFELARAGIRIPDDVRQLLETGTHNAAVQAVIEGKADVAFVRDGTVERMIAEGELSEDALKFLNAQYFPRFPYQVSTRLYPEWPVFALAHVPEPVIRHVAAALFAIEPDDPAARAAAIHGFTIPADYLPVEELARALRLPPFEAPPDFTVSDAWARWGVMLALLAVALALILVLVMLLSVLLRRVSRARQRFERLLAALGQGVYGVDQAGRCTFINRSARKMLGVETRDVIGENQHQLFHHHYPDGRAYPESDCPISRTLADGQARHMEEWFFRADRHRFPVDLTVTPLIEQGRRVGAVAAFSDVSARKAAESERDQLAERNRLLLESAGDGIYGVDLAGQCTFINPAALKMLGFSRDEVVGRDQHALFHYRREDGVAYPHAECPIHKTLHDHQVREGEETFIRKDGSMLPIHLRVAPLRNSGRCVGAVVVFQDVTERRMLEDRLLRMATTDALTGLANRRVLLERLEEECLRVNRSGREASLLMFDLDHFKWVNDGYGHAVGDRVLIRFSELLKANRRRTDVAARMGGEEFVLLMPDTSIERAREIALRLRAEVIQSPVETDTGGYVEYTVSVGGTAIRPQDRDVDKVLLRADQALYRAKDAGRNRVEIQ
ncbi:MAG: diguanylate cyclase [Halothiobacillaceae bacterium]